MHTQGTSVYSLTQRAVVSGVRTELGSGEIRVRVRVRVRVRISPHRTGLRRNEGTGVPEHILLISYFVSRRLLGANCIKRLSALQ